MMSPRAFKLVVPAVLVAGVWSVVAMQGCDRPATSTRALAAPVFGQAAIVGTVKFVGTPPPRRLFPDSANCHQGARPVQDEMVVVHPDHQGLRDVVVFIKDAPASDGQNQPQAVLDQVGCQYVPHVLPVQVNQQVKIMTSDPVFHNVHWLSPTNGNVNFGLPRPGDFKLHRFIAAESLRLRCDVHPWMEAHVMILPHPFFGASDRDGAFRINKLPAGTYTVVARHRILGDLEKQVTVGESGEVRLDFEFAGPK
jgi:hypothetical protein